MLLKPAAGGGGKGMRIVAGPDQLADAFGHVIFLGEREFSIQRRYQKIIEESPSPGVNPDLRQRMGRSACNLARQAGYVNAGTVEFVLAPDGKFYFLEMDTRLQVEHPVTELVTGMITRYAEPRGDTVRVDSGVDTGSKIGVHYDSMLAKVICHGKDRETARIALIAALVYHVRNILVRESVKSMVSRIGGGKGITGTHHYVVRSETDVYEIQMEKWPDGNQWTICVNQDRMVVDVPVKKGDCVTRGQNLVTLESMKMESGVASPVDGTIAEVLVTQGDAVDAGDVLVRFMKHHT